MPLLVGLLAGWSAFTLADWTFAARMTGMALTAGLMMFAAGTLYLFTQRRRKIGDPTLGY